MARMGDVLGGAFHVTYVENLPSIVRCGLVPSGIGGGNRLALHFAAFAPWDKMNLVTKTSLRNLRVGEAIAIIYVPSATLARYGAGVAFNGTFMVFDVIPFYEIKSIWIGQRSDGRCLNIGNVKRAYSKCVESDICPGFVGSSQESALMFLQNVTRVIEGSPETEASADNLHYIKDMVDRACALFRDGQHQELEILTNEIRDEISKTIILHDENWEGLRCRICPSCAATIPTCFCSCLECDAQLVSTGRFYVNVNSDDDDDHEPNVSGDARRAQEEANDNTAAQERDGGMGDDPDDDEMGTQGYTSGNASEEEEIEEEYRDNDTTARDIINSQQLAICLDEPREAQYMAGFIALQMSRMWGMFEAGDKRAIDAAIRGNPACPYHNDLGRYPNITEFDRAGIVLPSTEQKISQSQSVRSRTFRSIEDRDQFVGFSAAKCQGLYLF